MKVADVKKLIEEGKILISHELMTFFKDWLVKHIQGDDKQYGPFLNGKGIAQHHHPVSDKKKPRIAPGLFVWAET